MTTSTSTPTDAALFVATSRATVAVLQQVRSGWGERAGGES